MDSIGEMAIYFFTFVSVYAQVFLLFTFLENRKKIVVRNDSIGLSKYPGVTVIVPCWNEEKTVYKTVRSLLAQNYPKDKLHIFLIDDGSTDNTFKVISRFKKYKNVKVFRKENGGKSSALNLGLENVKTDFLGCLDADSVAHPEAVIRIMSYFEKDESAMAVAPSVAVFNAKTIIQKAQKAEYDMYAYIKKMLGFLGAIHVTPGPLTIFRKKVFDDLGPYRHAHNTEDMEIAYRMQKNYYKIEQCNDAIVYTNTPPTVKTLYKQRLRWIYGFLNNTIDYKKIMFRKKYGNFSLFTIPANLFSVFSVCFIFFRMVFNFGEFLYNKYIEISAVGVDLTANVKSLDLYFINTNTTFFLSFVVFVMLITSIMLGKKMLENKWKPSLGIIYFILTFGLIGPFWILKGVYNTVLSRKPAWR